MAQTISGTAGVRLHHVANIGAPHYVRKGLRGPALHCSVLRAWLSSNSHSSESNSHSCEPYSHSCGHRQRAKRSRRSPPGIWQLTIPARWPCASWWTGCRTWCWSTRKNSGEPWRLALARPATRSSVGRRWTGRARCLPRRIARRACGVVISGGRIGAGDLCRALAVPAT